MRAAPAELQRVAPAVLHLVPAARRLLSRGVTCHPAEVTFAMRPVAASTAAACCAVRAASAELQRVAPAVLHLVPAARRLLRAQHVRRRRRRELPQMSRDSGARGESETRRQTLQEARPQTQECVDL